MKLGMEEDMLHQIPGLPAHPDFHFQKDDRTVHYQGCSPRLQYQVKDHKYEDRPQQLQSAHPTQILLHMQSVKVPDGVNAIRAHVKPLPELR